jgi:hypothetical protein
VGFDFDGRRDELLLNIRGVSFLDAINAIEEHGVLLDFAHPNTTTYPDQRILVVNIDGYA